MKQDIRALIAVRRSDVVYLEKKVTFVAHQAASSLCEALDGLVSHHTPVLSGRDHRRGIFVSWPNVRPIYGHVSDHQPARRISDVAFGMSNDFDDEVLRLSGSSENRRQQKEE